MSEEKTELFKVDSTNPLPLEALFNHFATMIMERFDKLETELVEVKAELTEVKVRLTQVEYKLDHVDERITDLDEKVDAFVRETLHLKRELKQLAKPVNSVRNP